MIRSMVLPIADAALAVAGDKQCVLPPEELGARLDRLRHDMVRRRLNGVLLTGAEAGHLPFRTCSCRSKRR